MNSMLEVEYFNNKLLVRVTSRLEIKRVIMMENAVRFVLAYSSLLLQSLWLEDIGIMANTYVASQIISGNLSLESNNNLYLLLLLFKKFNSTQISS